MRGPGQITYKCQKDNEPTPLSETAELASDPEVSEKFTGKIETKDGTLVLTASRITEPTAENVLVLGDRPVTRPSLTAAPDARWVVVSNTGDDPLAGGLPGQNYVTRLDVEGGAPPRICPEGDTVTVDVEVGIVACSCQILILTAASVYCVLQVCMFFIFAGNLQYLHV